MPLRERVGVVDIVDGEGVQSSLVRRLVAAPVIDHARCFFSVATFATARATAELSDSVIMSTPCGVVPLARLAGRDVGLVLVVGGDDLDRLAGDLAAEVVDRHLRRLDGALAAEIGIEAGQIRQHADLDGVAGDLCQRRRGHRREADGGEKKRFIVLAIHRSLPFESPCSLFV